MVGFFSYVPVDDLAPGHGTGHGVVTLLKSADSETALLADPTYDPDQVGSRNFTNVTDTGTRQQVTNTRTGAAVLSAVCNVI